MELSRIGTDRVAKRCSRGSNPPPFSFAVGGDTSDIPVASMISSDVTCDTSCIGTMASTQLVHYASLETNVYGCEPGACKKLRR